MSPSMLQLAVTELLPWLQRQPAAGDSGRPLLLDVREPWEFELAAIRMDGAETVNLPMNEVPAQLTALRQAVSNGTAEAAEPRPVVCICHHGVRSAQVVAFLLRAGFESVYNLAGGIDAWSTQVDPAVPRY